MNAVACVAIVLNGRERGFWERKKHKGTCTHYVEKISRHNVPTQLRFLWTLANFGRRMSDTNFYLHSWHWHTVFHYLKFLFSQSIVQSSSYSAFLEHSIPRFLQYLREGKKNNMNWNNFMKWIQFWTADKSEHDPLKWMNNLSSWKRTWKIQAWIFFYVQMLRVKS